MIANVTVKGLAQHGTGVKEFQDSKKVVIISNIYFKKKKLKDVKITVIVMVKELAQNGIGVKVNQG